VEVTALTGEVEGAMKRLLGHARLRMEEAAAQLEREWQQRLSQREAQHRVDLAVVHEAAQAALSAQEVREREKARAALECARLEEQQRAQRDANRSDAEKEIKRDRCLLDLASTKDEAFDEERRVWKSKIEIEFFVFAPSDAAHAAFRSTRPDALSPRRQPPP